MATAEDAPTTDAVPPASENALDAPAAAEAPSSMPGSDDQDPPSPQGSSSSGDSLSTGEWHPNYYPTPSPAWIANLNLTVVRPITDCRPEGPAVRPEAPVYFDCPLCGLTTDISLPTPLYCPGCSSE